MNFFVKKSPLTPRNCPYPKWPTLTTKRQFSCPTEPLKSCNSLPNYNIKFPMT